ncbi:hypothetical protein [Nocardia cyriacigeorgica]|uniref:hypothetical protein n=1 Tax=Nocardia cyriacigeorgica TaxID=135487 RepID=UPI0013D0AFB4|nr:hypothetical protein [Nocardia cyriacigeorgica]MBF6438970.1 hypothetical protein [Nocardia cyriacigeorgica]MBF6455184.1 hypothetical protein [Nocardia cyriacigeorgica]MBF6478234.1 hypothetical protein [Nocardia cyriacigeorgica]MBF6554074.1 hypothetical protein [Nocardia cyriacigeorgica]NEW27772.1 hypothetical protein [Nocardia cyriacigeorgica]
MSEFTEITERLAQLPDADLLAVIRIATAGRAALAPVHEAAADMPAETGHVHPHPDVSPITRIDATHDPAVSGTASGQVGAVSPVPPVPGSPGLSGTAGYSSGGVPTFESVRDKVEQRYGTAQGMGELDRQTPAGRSADEQWQAREEAARERLEQIRKSLRDNDE